MFTQIPVLSHRRFHFWSRSISFFLFSAAFTLSSKYMVFVCVYVFHYKYLFFVLNLLISSSFFCTHCDSFLMVVFPLVVFFHYFHNFMCEWFVCVCMLRMFLWWCVFSLHLLSKYAINGLVSTHTHTQTYHNSLSL